jgi:hypothetical protein
MHVLGRLGGGYHIDSFVDQWTNILDRNGGHISPPLYHDYTSLKRNHGQAVAQKMIKLRLAHLEELRSVAEQEGILAESQWREVESVDVFYHSDMFEKAKTKVQTYKADLPFDAEHHEVYEAKEAIEVCFATRSKKKNLCFGPEISLSI